MSRIRIAEGKIIKTTGGAHHMYSEGNIVFNSGKTITEVGEENGITYDEPKDAPILTKKKQILSAVWMCAEMKDVISTASVGDKVSLLVKTINYKEGETITIVVDEVNGKDFKTNTKEVTFTGKINAQGLAELKEEVEIQTS